MCGFERKEISLSSYAGNRDAQFHRRQHENERQSRKLGAYVELNGQPLYFYDLYEYKYAGDGEDGLWC